MLLLHPDPRLTGGVISFLETLLRHFGPSVGAERFVVGRRQSGWGARLGMLIVLVDLLRLARVLRAGRFDVVHVNPSLNAPSLIRDGAFLVLVRWLSSASTCVFVHGWDAATARRLAASRLWRALFARTFGRADRILVLARVFRRQLVDLGCDPEAVEVATTMFSGGDVRRVERACRPVRTLLFMARFVPEKGACEVLEAFRLLRERGHDLHLLMAGSGPEQARLEAVAAAAGMAGLVTFTGFVRGADKARVLRAADLFLLPTRHGEGCPVAVLEAMAAGLPVVATPVGGIPDVIEHGRHGWILDSSDAAALADAVEALIALPRQVAQIGRSNREAAWARYEASVVTRRIEEIYRRL